MRKRGNRKDKLLTIFIFFVVAPIISIVIGVFIVQKFILPHFEDINDNKPISKIESSSNKDKNNENIIIKDKDKRDKQEIDDSRELELTIEGFDLYNVQLGSFSNIENAKKLRKELRDKGANGYIVKIGNYKVFYGTYLNRKMCDKVLTNIRKLYKDAFVNKIVVDDFVIKYNSTEQKTADVINEIIKTFKKSFDEETSLWYYVLIQKDLQEITKVIRKNNEQIDKLLNGIDENIEDSSFSGLLDDIKIQVKERKQILQNLTGNKENIQDSYDKYYKMLFDFIKIFK
ncbi:Sporulation related domain-containing protein [Caloranaerobacter azorensis DSM 13643]|uniref:Sporulation related domain-containing protein n=1 Tax=Caloranaerobacter azorensis DSM 13643 TaxID=1121264 RepID=A0A1M5UDW3_9FIRM|nr:SPOR domain-containing protein [Caloranaerobacter azorensis]SHH61224.1 Sporulation related domain-containing protein [Caloranaerobacter azorensis DSM 13643]